MAWPSSGGHLNVVTPAGQTAVLTLTPVAGATPTYYTVSSAAGVLSSSTTSPITFSGTQNIYVAEDQDFTVSVKIEGAEAANGNGSTVTWNARSATHLYIAPATTPQQNLFLEYPLAGDMGYSSWAYDPAASTGNFQTTGGTQIAVFTKVPPGTTISNIDYYLQTSGGTLTSGQNFLAVYGATSGALLGQSADQSTNFAAAAGLKTATFATPITVPSDGKIYVALWAVGTTQPKFASQGTLAHNASANSLVRFGTANTGQTTTAASTLGTVTASATASVWFGVH